MKEHQTFYASEVSTLRDECDDWREKHDDVTNRAEHLTRDLDVAR